MSARIAPAGIGRWPGSIEGREDRLRAGVDAACLSAQVVAAGHEHPTVRQDGRERISPGGAQECRLGPTLARSSRVVDVRARVRLMAALVSMS